MPSVLSLKEIRSSNTLKDQLRKLEIEKEELAKQLDFQKKVELKLREDILAHRKDFEHLEKQFEHFAGLEADYEELQNTLAMERLEKMISSDKVEDKSNVQLDKTREELKKAQAELKELKQLDPQRLKRQVGDLKKKSATQASENQSLNKALVAARKELREVTAERDQLKAELEASRKGQDFFWQSKDRHWQLYESAQLLKDDDAAADDLPKGIRCLNTVTGTSCLSRELGENDQAVWLGEAEIPEEVSIEAGKRHKKLAAEAEEAAEE